MNFRIIKTLERNFFGHWLLYTGAVPVTGTNQG